MRDVYLSGTGMTAFGKFPARTVADLAAEAVDAALADAGCDPAEVGFVAFGNAVGSLITGQAMIQGQLALAGGPLAGVGVVNVENACATGSSAVHLAAMAIRAGECETAVAVGAEKLTHPDKARSFAALGTALDVADPALRADRRDTVFMGLYAGEARDYLARTGAPLRALARVAAKSHRHGSLNPRAQYRDVYSEEDILGARLVDDPLTVLMCSPIGDGAAAVVVTARRPPQAVRIAGTALRTGRPGEHGGLVARVARIAYDRAGIAPSDVDVAEVHDGASPAELPIVEELGLVPAGRAWRHVLDGELDLGGRLPVNPSGGLVSRGHPIGATGCAQLVELADQLRGRCGTRQVPGARVGVAQNAGGAVEIGPHTSAVSAVTVLERV